MDKINDNETTNVVATVSHHDTKEGMSTSANQQEHELTLKTVFKHHKAVIWWCFHWAMCAIGW